MSKPHTKQTADIDRRAWHAVPAQELASALDIDDLDGGLDRDEIEKRQEHFGANRLTPQSERTALKRFLTQFRNLFIYLLLAALTFLVGVFVWGREWGEMLLAAVTIAVAAIPEGLPDVMTVTLAIGVQRMARRNAIIRRLPAVETLGSISVVCSDKTGTPTRNEMTVWSLLTADEDIEVEGVGYAPDGGFRLDEHDIELEKHANAIEMVRAGMLCNDAGLDHDGDEWKPEGDPTETALVVLAHKAGLDPERWRRRLDEIAGRGQRMLAVAYKALSGESNELHEDDAEHDLTLLGLFGLIDPPRKEAIDAVAACQAAGIRVKMITGDHALTAKAIARELGIENPDEALTGRDLEEFSLDELRRHAISVEVFARASPEHKLHLVEALQEENVITAMTGDGVNDAPALKRADIGIAMGQKGTDATHEAAAMVLADDNFASIEQAIEEGRTVYDNLKKAILFILPTNFAEALVIVIAILAGRTLPMTPVHLLWINMITAARLRLGAGGGRSDAA